MRQLDYGHAPGKPSGWQYAAISFGMGIVGVISVSYSILCMEFGFALPPWRLSVPVFVLGCCYWLVAPVGAALGALVLDERADVVRLAWAGIVLNILAFVGALYASYNFEP